MHNESTQLNVKLGKYLLFLIGVLFLNNSHSYFLSVKQKGQLLVNGNVVDVERNVFNVRIVPGYREGVSLGSKYWLKGFTNEEKGGVRLGKGLLKIPLSVKHSKYYFTSGPYKGIGQSYKQGYKAEKYLFKNYMGINLVGAWQNYFEYANKAYRKKTFGWWLSYPWAVVKGTLNSSIRLVTGLPASVASLSYPLIIRPAYEITKPIAKTGFDVIVGGGESIIGVVQFGYGFVGNQIIGGTAFPLTSIAWTTLVGLPLGFLGKEPTIESEDGWWVVMLPESPDYIKKLDLRLEELSDKFPKIIVRAQKSYQYEEKIRPHFLIQNSKLKKIEEERKKVRQIYRMVSDSLRKEIVGELNYQYYGMNKFPLTEQEEGYVTGIVSRYLTNDSLYLMLKESEQKNMVTFIVDKFGRKILVRPRSELSNPYSKTGPSTILNEEVKEIIHGK